jgi:hypothetical protein
MKYQGLDENHEEKYGKLKVSRTPKLTALARIMQLLDIPIMKAECIDACISMYLLSHSSCIKCIFACTQYTYRHIHGHMD